jgi:hypothetical protein
MTVLNATFRLKIHKGTIYDDKPIRAKNLCLLGGNQFLTPTGTIQRLASWLQRIKRGHCGGKVAYATILTRIFKNIPKF